MYLTDFWCVSTKVFTLKFSIDLFGCSFIKEFESPSKSNNDSYDATADGEKVQHFVAHMEQVFMSHPLWRGNMKEINDQAVEVGTCAWMYL